MPEASWEPYEKHGTAHDESDLPTSVYAFPKQRKKPLDRLRARACTASHRSIKPSHGSIKPSTSSDEDRDLAFGEISRKLHGSMVSTSWKGRGTIWASAGGREEKRHQTRCDVNRGGM